MQPEANLSADLFHDRSLVGDVTGSASTLVEAIASAAVAVSKARDLEAVLAAVVDQVMALGARSAHVMLATPDEQTLVLGAHRRIAPALAKRLERVSLDAPLLAARAASTRDLQIVSDLEQLDPALTLARELIEDAGARAMVCAPLLASGRLLGVLSWTLEQARSFSSAERRAIRAIADLFAVGIANVRELDTGAYERLVLTIAHSHRLEQRLRDHETRLRAIFDHTYQFVGLLSTDGILLEANQAALDFIGRTRQETVGRPFWEAEWWSGAPAQQEQLREAVHRAARGEVVRYETTHPGKDGQVMAVDFSLTPVRDDAGEVVLVVPEGRDITAHKQLEKLREEWISVVAHDLRQPINAIELWAQLLGRTRAEDPARTAQGLAHIRASVTLLSRMTSDLLDSSRLEAGRLALQRRPTDLAALTHAVVARVVDEGSEVQIATSGEIPTLHLDPDRIEQALGNLLSNAKKYRRKESPIHVALERTETAVHVAITNFGDGIDAAEVPRLFQRFHRTRTAAQSGTSGIGLGLYITRALVEAHGGTVSVESQAGGKTTFKVTLPVG